MTINTRFSSLACATVALLLSLAPALPAQVPPPPPPPPPMPSAPPSARVGTSVLGGTVVADDGSGRTIRRAQVTVSGSGLARRMLLTDAAGRFVFTDLPAGSYAISVSKPGWLTGYHGARDAWRGPAAPVVVGDGGRRTDLVLRLTPGAVVTGRVLDPFGRPQAGAYVAALERRRYAGRDTFAMVGSVLYSARQTTDDRGEFRIFGLPPGEFIVGASVVGGVTTPRPVTTADEVAWAERARRAGITGSGQPPPAPGPAVEYLPVFHPGVTDPSDASIITLSVGEERAGADVSLRFVPSVAVRGTVTLPDGEPAPGIPLLMLSAGGPTVSAPTLTWGIRGRGRSGPDASFAIQPGAPGEYVIVARGSSEGSTLWADQPVSVGSEDIDGLAIRLQPGLTVSGRLAFSGSILDPPADLTSVSVGVVSADQQGVSVRVPEVRANPDGTFAIEGVPPGRYVLTASPPRGPGDAAWLAHRASIEGRNAIEVPFEVVAGRHLEDVVVELTDQPAQVSGLVTDANGQPVSGLTLVLFPVDPAAWAAPADGDSIRTAPLDNDGHYRIDELRPGDYFLAALAQVADADLADPAFLERLAANAIRVSLALGERKVQDVRLAGR